MAKWTVRFIWTLIVLETLYLLIANVGLNQPFIKAEINSIKPDKMTVQWRQLRSYFPTHIQVLDLTAAVNTSRSHWNVSADKASLTLDLNALFDRILKVKNGSLENMEIVLTRKLEELTELNRLDNRNQWQIDFSNVDIHGAHRVTVPQGTTTFDGNISGTMRYSAATKTLAVSDGEADLKIKTLVSAGQHWLPDGGDIKGNFQLLPFVPRDHRGKQVLKFLQGEAEVYIVSDDMSFLNPVLDRFNGMTLTGKGEVVGQVKLDRGRLMPSTELTVTAKPLEIDLLRFKMAGEGNITLTVDDNKSQDIIADILFSKLIAYDQNADHLLAQGAGLNIIARTPGFSLIEKQTTLPDGEISLVIPKMEVPDIGVYQSYIPEKFRFALTGGSGFLEGEVKVEKDTAITNLTLTARDATVAFDKYDFNSDLEILLALKIPSYSKPSLDLSGSAVSLKNVIIAEKLKNLETTKNLRPFFITFKIAEGIAKFSDLEGDKSTGYWVDMLRQKQTRDLFEQAHMDVTLTGQVSSLGWIEQLIKNENDFTIVGAGKLDAQLSTRNGFIQSGSHLNIAPKNLSATFLDYRIRGDGKITVTVSQGGPTPDLESIVRFDNGILSGNSEAAEFATVNDVQLIANSRQVDLDTPTDNSDLHILIPSARVLDMTEYNTFLPPHSPLKLLSGMATLSADIKLTKEDAEGQIKLETDGLKAAFDSQSIAARLSMDIDIIDGNPKDMHFNISGSTIAVDQIEIKNDDGTTEILKDGTWRGDLKMTKSLVNWRKPIDIDLEADLKLTDTRPFVTILSNHVNSRRGWLEKLLSVENVKGTGTMTLNENIIRFPLVQIDAGHIKLGAKGVIKGKNREGLIYARYRKLGGLLRINGEESDFDLLRARAKFDNYSPGQSISINQK